MGIEPKRSALQTLENEAFCEARPPRAIGVRIFTLREATQDNAIQLLCLPSVFRCPTQATPGLFRQRPAQAESAVVHASS